MAKLFRAAIMGPPGSGKGTISKRIAQSFGLEYLSSGHFLRDSVAANTGKTHLPNFLRFPEFIQQVICVWKVFPNRFLKKKNAIPGSGSHIEPQMQ